MQAIIGRSDQVLLQGFLAGSSASGQEFVERYESPLHCFAFYLTGSGPLAEQIAGDALIALMDSAQDYLTESSARESSARSHLLRYVYTVAAGQPSAETPLSIEVIRDQKTLPENVRVLTSLVSLTFKMPLEYRAVFILSDFLDILEAEGADVLSISVDEFSQRLHRARGMIRRMLLKKGVRQPKTNSERFKEAPEANISATDFV